MTVHQSFEIKCINTLRVLCADMVEKAKSGHPGAPMGLSPVVHLLFTAHMQHSPSNSKWWNRDRFILSNGHACALLYSILSLTGYKVPFEELKRFRQLDSMTPGHPECHLTDGVEVTTGPLGQGLGNAVGIAIAESHLSSVYNRPRYPLFEHYTFCICGDGDLQEGVSSEALSLAGHLQLNRLIIIYDDNKITIDGETDLSFTENVTLRMQAYGFHVLDVPNADNDFGAINAAIIQAKSNTNKPTFIRLKTTIGYGSTYQATEKVHGSPLGEEELKKVKKFYGFNPEERFVIPDDVHAYYAQIKETGSMHEKSWNDMFSRYEKDYPELAQELKRRFSGELPKDWESLLPIYNPSDAPIATRKASENVLNKIAELIPELIGGSADLTTSNLTRWKTAVDFQPLAYPTLGSPTGRYLRFGVREHGMMAISNGLAAYGGFLPFAGTFLNFITYAWGAVRLAALSHFRALYILTHDSIGLGEDGPTHQPIETLAALRALPNMLTIRPADANEVSGAYAVALKNRTRPSAIILSRQALPHLEGSSLDAVRFGAYVLKKLGNESKPKVILVATGSEVSIMMETAVLLFTQNAVDAWVVSMPSWELFNEQPLSYQHSVFVPATPVISLEALSTFGWSKYAHISIGMEEYGASAPYQHIYKHLAFEPKPLSEKVLKVLDYFKDKPIPNLPFSFPW